MIRFALCFLLFASAAPAQEAVQRFGPEDAAVTLRLRTTTDIAIFAPTVEAFLDTAPGVAILYEQWGSNDLYALSREDCASGRKAADIIISSAVHQMVKLVNDRCAASWRSPATQAVPSGLKWRDELWGITREPAVMVYNRALVPPDEVPLTRFDLLDLLRPQDSRYAGRVATYDIEASGLGFLFAFIDSQEASTFGALMETFARTGAIATCCSAEIIGGVIEGDYLIAYNVLGSYARSVAAIDSRLGIVEPRDYTVVLSRAAMLPGPDVRPEAGAFLDYLVSTEGKIAMARSFLISGGGEDESGSDASDNETARRPIRLSPSLLVAVDQANATRFIRRWREVFAQ
ncbi:iron-binding protein [Ruegeria marisrubri]|uniref:Iron-binding protein n=1 Tax=Ruegeria marisrubri TaxID=1685379 RepID=A0A0X3TBK7_9RHOB|nr:ABC transporter substrate-binding protein [Ruegeria marisrubri]KUJ73162.1 iron-binding protein [Ruegeria marisrubri]